MGSITGAMPDGARCPLGNKERRDMNDWKDLLKPEIIWAVAGLIMLLSEFAMPGLIIFFFGLGALLVAGVCLVADPSLNAQLGLFIVGSVAMLLVLRRWVRGAFMGYTSDRRGPNENLKTFVGETAVVTEALAPRKSGKVELNGAEWKARADEEIEQGAEVEVVDQDSLTLKVKRR